MPDTATQSAILAAARELFARRGYEGASVRAITGLAGVNLGAIAYHFGSKRALFDAVTGSMARAARERIVAAAQTPGDSLVRAEAVVRAFFDFLYENPDVPPLVIHMTVSGDSIPEAARCMMGENLRTLSRLIGDGQVEGSIRAGDPELMALSVISQPLWLALARRVLSEGVSVNQEDPEARRRLVESVVDFVRAGLVAS